MSFLCLWWLRSHIVFCVKCQSLGVLPSTRVWTKCVHPWCYSITFHPHSATDHMNLAFYPPKLFRVFQYFCRGLGLGFGATRFSCSKPLVWGVGWVCRGCWCGAGRSFMKLSVGVGAGGGWRSFLGGGGWKASCMKLWVHNFRFRRAYIYIAMDRNSFRIQGNQFYHPWGDDRNFWNFWMMFVSIGIDSPWNLSRLEPCKQGGRSVGRGRALG